jgi:hypothetical protein
MCRRALVLTALLLGAVGARAAEPLHGNWQLVRLANGIETTVAIVKLETKDGKPCATVAFSPYNIKTTVTDLKMTDKTVTLALRQVQTIQNRKLENNIEFIGVRRGDDKAVLGSIGDERFQTRAKLLATDKTELAPNEMTIRTPAPEPMQELQKLNGKWAHLMNQARREEDADKKKELQKQAADARKEIDEKTPGFYREVIEKHADSPAALDAAINLVRARTGKIDAAEASKLVAVIKGQTEPFGPRFVAVTLSQVAESLISRSGLESAAVAAIEPVARSLADDELAGIQSRVLTAYVTALEKTGKAADAKPFMERLAVVDKRLDDEYLAKVPPFKPEHFAGRKDKGASQVVVLELFTGAQCPPCVAADVAFDALGHAYKPSDLVLIQYHMHIPGPDPMVNPDCIARWDYYREKFPQGVRGTPTVVFNGEVKDLRGGGNMAMSEGKYKEYREVIDPLLEKSSPVKIDGKAARRGDKVTVDVDVAGAEGEDLKLRLVVVEDVVKFVGGNSLRFHHHVVRALPGGPAGVAVKGKAFHHTAALDVAEVRQGLDKYLTGYAAERPFPQPGRPMDMKNLKVIALVQNDATGAILQAAQIDVE